MNITKHLVSVFVLPNKDGLDNVISRVMWIVRFEDGGHRSEAFVETLLDTNNIAGFIPANQVGTERVLGWAFAAQGGDAFISQITPHHLQQIEYLKSIEGQQAFTEGFNLYTPLAPTNMPSAVL